MPGTIMEWIQLISLDILMNNLGHQMPHAQTKKSFGEEEEGEFVLEWKNKTSWIFKNDININIKKMHFILKINIK